jgi:UDP:flavonoid glycosyltransferase YjiC (YdhE family)
MMTRWLLNNKKLARPFNKVAAYYHLPPFKNTNEVLMGDQTLICDDIHFLGVKPSEIFPRENFIGPIIARTPKESQMLDKDLEEFIARPGKTIVLVFGSTNDRKIFTEIFETLRKTDYKVIAVSKKLLGRDYGPNILIREFIPLEEVLKKADLAISHGGRGTIYTIAYSGKPAICLPFSYEHQINIDNLVRVGAAIRIPKKNFKTQQVIFALKTIFDNYEMYLKNARSLSVSLPKESGEARAVQRLLEILQSYQKTTTYS